MVKRKKIVKQDEGLSFIGAYSGTTDLSITPVRDRQKKDISSYPSPRAYSEEYLKTKDEETAMMPV